MLKLIIAEDEALERKALRYLLEKNYKDSIQIVYEVTNGKDAVNKTLELKPDIILMDINMPVMNGLEASRIIKNQCKDIEIVILTAFNYFDYAKTAINIGVCDYLLKPISNSEFFESMEKLKDKINTKISNESKNKKLNENYKKVIPLLEKEMVTNIVYRVSLTDEQLCEYKEILNINGEKYCSMVFSKMDEKKLNDNLVYTIKNKLKMIFSEVVGCICLNDIVLFIFDEDIEGKILGKRFEDTLEGLNLELSVQLEASCFIGIGCIEEETDKFYLSYKEAKLSCESKRNGKVNGEYESQQISSMEFDLSEREIAICGRVINEDLEGAIQELDNIKSSLLSNSETNDFLTIKDKLMNLFNIIIINMSEFIGEDFKSWNTNKELEELIYLKDLKELKYCGNMIIKNFITYISNYKKSKNIDVVEKAKRYIEKNYMNEITLDEVAQYVSLSSFYLSRTFTKIEGVNLRDYLIKIRMEKAKSMLRDGKKSIKQIAMEVGYVDQNYFSKAFKKYTGMSPKDYINL